MHVRVEPAWSHEATPEIDAFGGSGLTGEVRPASDGGNATVTREEGIRRDTGAHVDPSAVKERRPH
jgi:hypothetical protein